jgi:aspartate/methionine/tyrosine aminotransferase
MIAWPAAPYVAWARARPAARYDLAASDLQPVTGAEWPPLLESDDRPIDDPPSEEGVLAAAIAAHCGVDAEQVVTAVGSAGANLLAMAALLRPRDAVIVEEPGYAPIAGAARLFGADVIVLKRRAECGYRVDPAALRTALTPRTRLVVLTRPHNPTGALIDEPTLQAVAAIADEARVHVLVDEVYLDTVIGPAPTAAAHVSDRFISTSSLTKAYGLSGLHCGWALASPSVAQRMRAARAVIGAAAPSRTLALRAFADLEVLRKRALGIVARNQALLARHLGGRADVAWTPPAAGTVAFPRLPRVADIDAFVDRLLVERYTAVVPGRFFGQPQHVRVAFGMGTDELAGGLEALTAALDALTPVETIRS